LKDPLHVFLRTLDLETQAVALDTQAVSGRNMHKVDFNVKVDGAYMNMLFCYCALKGGSIKFDSFGCTRLKKICMK
jgi:hypothetical protein